MIQCPKCGAIDDANWPITVGGQVVEGGCQNCWEAECDADWWAAVPVWAAMGLLGEDAQARGEIGD